MLRRGRPPAPLALGALALAPLGCAQPLQAPSPDTPDAQVAPRDAPFDAFVLPPVVPSVPGYCSAPSHCDDGDECTVDVCHVVSPVRFQGTCAHERIEGCVTPPDAGRPDAGATDAGRDAATARRDAGTGPESPIDPACASGGALAPVLLAYVPLGTPDLAPDCAGGLEMQNCSDVVSLRRTDSAGAIPRTLVVDVATYTQPDRLRIHGIDATGAPYVLLDTCRIRTSEVGDPTDGRSRPPDAVIRRFEVEVREGTQSLALDATGTSSPWYMRVLGLCDFRVSAIGLTCEAALRDAVP